MSDTGDGTSVTLVVRPGSTTPGTTPSTNPPGHRPGTMPFTGLELVPLLLAAALLLALGLLLVGTARSRPRRT